MSLSPLDAICASNEKAERKAIEKAIRFTHPETPVVGALVVDRDSPIPEPRLGKIVDLREYDNLATVRDPTVWVKWLDGTKSRVRTDRLISYHSYLRHLEERVSTAIAAFAELQKL